METDQQQLDKLLRVAEVALRLGIGRTTAYRKIAEGTIPAIRLGPGKAALRVRESELERWLTGDEAA